MTPSMAAKVTAVLVSGGQCFNFFKAERNSVSKNHRARGKPKDSHFNQQLHIVVVGHAHLEIGRESTELRIDVREHA